MPRVQKLALQDRSKRATQWTQQLPPTTAKKETPSLPTESVPHWYARYPFDFRLPTFPSARTSQDLGATSFKRIHQNILRATIEVLQPQKLIAGRIH